MADHFIVTIEAMQASITAMQTQIIEKKKLVNLLAAEAKLPPIYSDEEIGTAPTAVTGVAREDEFFNKPLTTCIKTFLERRQAAGPQSAAAIYAGLLAGGYEKFVANKDDAINGLRISMAKNATVFARIPKGDDYLYGLNSWYGIRRAKSASGSGKDQQTDTTETNGNGASTEAALRVEADGGEETI